MKSILKAYIPFLIYSFFVTLMYFLNSYYFPRYCEVLPYFSIMIVTIYYFIGTFIFGYILGKITQRRLCYPSIGICILLAIVSSLIMLILEALRHIFWILERGYSINFESILYYLNNFVTRLSVLGTLIFFFIGEIVEYHKQKTILKN
ncbi:hypothetical protein [Clostridium cadaveris]|uniref:hypothetical protein n=1 Tax=Clostridium cadaveris TaxID=1529 RepID=UPI000C07FEE5|nr:hypothetical protein [Clostridium cadaveris]